MPLERLTINRKGKEITVMVARRGRPRKPGKRERNGRLQRGIDPEVIASTMPHRRNLPEGRRRDQRGENLLGRLWLIGIIDDLQLDAGEQFRGVVARYRTVIQAPNANPCGNPLERTDRGMPIVLSDLEAQRRTEEYNKSFESIRGHRPRVIVKSVVIYDKPLQSEDLPYLRCALDDLAEYFGLTKSGKSRVNKYRLAI